MVKIQLSGGVFILDKKKLIKKIEELREAMHRLSEENVDEFDNEVLKKSQELDEVLFEYQSLLRDEQ